MNLKSAIAACADFTHATTDHYQHFVRGKRIATGVELTATDGYNLMRVTVKSEDLAPEYSHLPDTWLVSGKGAKAITAGSILEIGPRVVSDTYVATYTTNLKAKSKSGRAAKPGPEIVEIPESQSQRSWRFIDLAISQFDASVKLQATAKLGDLIAALEPLDGSATVLLTARIIQPKLARVHFLEMNCKGWEKSVFCSKCSADPISIKLPVSKLWAGLSHMDGERVEMLWSSDGPARFDCGSISFLMSVTTPEKKDA